MIAAGTHRGLIRVLLTPSAPSANAAATAARPQALWHLSHSFLAAAASALGLQRAAVRGKRARASVRYPTHLCGVGPATGSSSPRASPTHVNSSTKICRAACGKKTRALSWGLFLLSAIREMAVGARRHQAASRMTPWT